MPAICGIYKIDVHNNYFSTFPSLNMSTSVPVAYEITNPVFIPVAQAYPEFASIQALEVPTELKGAVSPELWGLINSSSTWTVRQHVKLLPKAVLKFSIFNLSLLKNI
jgi:hypothetical protein